MNLAVRDFLVSLGELDRDDLIAFARNQVLDESMEEDDQAEEEESDVDPDDYLTLVAGTWRSSDPQVGLHYAAIDIQETGETPLQTQPRGVSIPMTSFHGLKALSDTNQASIDGDSAKPARSEREKIHPIAKVRYSNYIHHQSLTIP